LERCSRCCTAEQQEGGRKGKDVPITIQEELSMQRCSHDDEDRNGSNPGRGARSPPQQKGMKFLSMEEEISGIEGFLMQIFFNEEADRRRQLISMFSSCQRKNYKKLCIWCLF
jgi:hypothetical protein